MGFTWHLTPDPGTPDPGPRYRGRHAAPGRAARAGRAVCRGAARAAAFPLWPGHVAYQRLEIAWT